MNKMCLHGVEGMWFAPASWLPSFPEQIETKSQSKCDLHKYLRWTVTFCYILERMIRGKWMKSSDSVDSLGIWVEVEEWKKNGAHSLWFQNQHRGSWEGRGRYAHGMPKPMLLHSWIILSNLVTPDAQAACGPIKPESWVWCPSMLDIHNDYNEQPKLTACEVTGWSCCISLTQGTVQHPATLFSSVIFPKPMDLDHISSLSESASAHSNLGIPNLFQTWILFWFS